LSDPDTTSVTLVDEIFPGDTNPYGTAFGGRILSLMDKAAGMAAAKFARTSFVTASLDAIDFRAPARQGEIVEIEARVVYTSTHTCGIKIIVLGSDKALWERRICCEGVMFMVAIDEDGKTQRIPQLTPGSAEDRAAWAEVEAIHKRMLSRRRRPKG
jgi:acyl-CoA hydrolase